MRFNDGFNCMCYLVKRAGHILTSAIWQVAGGKTLRFQLQKKSDCFSSYCFYSTSI